MSPRRKTGDPWPWPADSPLDRARRIARSYRDALAHADPEQCHRLDERAAQFGQTWIRPRTLRHDEQDLLTTNEVAEFCDVQPATVDQWRKRGLRVTHTPDGPRYRVADVLDYHAARRRTRAGVDETG